MRDDITLLDLALKEHGSARRWRLAAVLTWALIGAAALGWAWSLWLAPR